MTETSSKHSSFVCAACGGEFESDWSDEEAAAEALATFGEHPVDAGMAKVCDDCYEAMKPMWEQKES